MKTAEEIVRELAQSCPTTEAPDDCVFCDQLVGRNAQHLDSCLVVAAKKWVAAESQSAFSREKLGSGIDWPTVTLLDLCREFEAIDLFECNRRLEAGEKFDAACEEAMEKRVALGEQIKECLGSMWPEFEKSHAELAANFPSSSKLAEHALACVTTEAMKDVRSFFMFGSLASRESCGVPIDDCQTDFLGTAIRAMRRLMVLAKAFGIEAARS